MKYNNPIIKGFYPDPSVCKVDDTYYLVCSSFQYFPGVPIFKSTDLVNWDQIGYCLTRKSQLNLDKARSSGGIFAPTIRYNNGRFYMVTTNVDIDKNFYVWTDDIYGEWSEPIYVEQGGIDPSLYFEDGKSYFMSNGQDDDGNEGVTQCEIDIKTGEKLSKSRTIWQGSGGRYLEGPHMYKIKDKYYLLAAEGGTEYGHMITYARADSLYGEFKSYEGNPVLTNRNLGGYEIQGVGHGDLICDNYGNYWLVHLGFRQESQWKQYHHLGREVFLSPVKFNEYGWFTAGIDGTTRETINMDIQPYGIEQINKRIYTFKNTEWDKEWSYLRNPNKENYELGDEKIRLRGSKVTLDDVDSPTFICMHQKDFNAEVTCDVSIADGEAGLTIYMDENHHYDLLLRKFRNRFEVIKKLNVGDIKSVEEVVPLKDTNKISLCIKSNNEYYEFFVKYEDKEVSIGKAQTKYLSSEVAEGFTGVVIGLYSNSESESFAEFVNFECKYL